LQCITGNEIKIQGLLQQVRDKKGTVLIVFDGWFQ